MTLNSPVLVVDDSEDIRETLKKLLEAVGFSVLTAADGSEALAVLERSPRVGIILLDLMMPVMNGAEFMAAQRNNSLIRAIPVVILTANPYRVEASLVGVADVLVKPVDPERLVESITKHSRPTATRREA